MGHPTKLLSKIRSLPVGLDSEGYAEKFYQAPNRAFSIMGAASAEDHRKLSGSIDDGERFLCDDLKEAIGFQSSHHAAEARACWKTQMSPLHSLPGGLQAARGAIEAGLKRGELSTRGNIHIPLFVKLLERAGDSGRATGPGSRCGAPRRPGAQLRKGFPI